ncbi:hypothetical protein D3C81_1030090 [compost metagenome]
MEALAVGLRQLAEFGLVQRLAVLHRREGDVGAVAVQGDALLQRQLLDHVQGAVVALVEDALDGALLLLVTRRLERRRKGRQQVVDQLVDVVHQRLRAPRGQLQRTRFARIVEVVDVDPVARRGLALGFGLEVAAHEGEAPGARLAHHEHVVAGPRHGHAELQGGHRALLAEHAAERLQLVGTGESQLFGTELAAELRRQQAKRGEEIGHQRGPQE